MNALLIVIVGLLSIFAIVQLMELALGIVSRANVLDPVAFTA